MTAPRHPTVPDDAGRIIRVALEASHDKKAHQPEVLDLRGLASFTDFFVIVSGTSHRQVQALGDGILDAFSAARIRPHHVEGLDANEWVLIDAGDVIVHVFLGDKRVFYDIEGLWRDARRLPVTLPDAS
ncbi:MAG: ribosome silencing factor [Acidobacteriota bacterium]